MYAAIRQGKAKAGMAEELARRIKEGAVPIISDVEGFMAYYVVYAPDDTVTAISIFNNHARAEESNRRGLAWIEENSHASACWTSHSGSRACDCSYIGVAKGCPSLGGSYRGKAVMPLLGRNVAVWHVASFGGAAKIGRNRANADLAGPAVGSPRSRMSQAV
jgi:hypothetical protein